MESQLGRGFYFASSSSLGSIYTMQYGIPMELQGAGIRQLLLYGVANRGETANEPVVVDQIERNIELILFNTPPDLQGKIFAIRCPIGENTLENKRIATELKATPELAKVFGERRQEYDDDCERYWSEFSEVLNRTRERMGIASEDFDRDPNSIYPMIVAQMLTEELPIPMNRKVSGIDEVLLRMEISQQIEEE